MIDVQAMKRIALQSYEVAIDRAYGSAGMNSMRELIEFLIAFYAYQDPEMISGVLYVVHRVASVEPEAIEACVGGSAQAVERRVEDLQLVSGPITVIDVEAGVYRMWRPTDFNETAACSVAIVYRFHKRSESFLVDGRRLIVDKPLPSHASNFSRPRFSSLREALVDYSKRVVRTSACFILSGAWEDAARLFLRPKPEHIMRRSLQQHLRATLRDALTRPEQSVDESHPVDLRVEWDFTAQEAIIEIKWLGACRENGKISVKNSPQVAKRGAGQLAGYLASSRQSAPTRQTRGYLVVIDARRRKLSAATTLLAREDAMYYEDREIHYSPEYHKLRDDFEPPFRMFAEPA